MKILCWFTLLAVVVSVSAEGSGFDPEGSGLDPEGSDLVTCNNKADDNNPEVKSRVCEDWMLMGYCTHPDADTRKRTHELCMKSCAPVIGVQCEEDPNDIKNMLGSWDEFEEWLNCPSCLMGSCGCQLFNCCTEQYMGTMEWEEWQKGQGKMWALYGPWQHNWQEKTASGVIQGYDSEHPESPEYETADPEGNIYKKLDKKHCASDVDYGYGSFGSVREAQAACSRDWNCQSVYDSGCVSQTVYLCPFGSDYSSSVSSCIYEKDFAAYGVPEYGSADYSDYDYADYEGSN